jgi:hypothetical protein
VEALVTETDEQQCVSRDEPEVVTGAVDDGPDILVGIGNGPIELRI